MPAAGWPKSGSIQMMESQEENPWAFDFRQLLSEQPITKLKIQVPKDHEKLIQDLIKVQSSLITKEKYEAGLRYLEEQLKKRRKLNVEDYQDIPQITEEQLRKLSLKKVLTEELVDKETRCGFTPGAPVYWKVLSQEVFAAVSKEGRLFKDVGAGFQHGEYTHRIQWYVVLYNWTNGFETGFEVKVQQPEPYGYNYTPKELLVKINLGGLDISNKKLWPRGEVSGFGGAWDALLDRNNSQYFQFKFYGLTSPEAFNAMLFDPVKVLPSKETHRPQGGFSDVKVAGASTYVGHLSKTYPTLSEIVTRRFLKRKEERPAKETEFVEYMKRKTEIAKPKYKETEKESGVLIPSQ
jgi:hypothetical protein